LDIHSLVERYGHPSAALALRFFNLAQVSEAVWWAEQGNIAVLENYNTRRKTLFHVMSASQLKLRQFCDHVSLPHDHISTSEYFKFFHLDWTVPLADFTADSDPGILKNSGQSRH